MWCSRLAAAVIVAVFGSTPALAWWDEGHMQIAFLAYKRLGAPIKDKVDALLSLNKDYPKWTAGAPDEKTAKLYAFIHAATWADDIKRKEYGYRRDNVDSPTANQRNGWARRLFLVLAHLLDGNPVLSFGRNIKPLGRYLYGFVCIGCLNRAEMLGALADDIDTPARHLQHRP